WPPATPWLPGTRRIRPPSATPSSWADGESPRTESCPPTTTADPAALRPPHSATASDHLTQLEDGQVHGNHDAADDGAEDHDDDGLHQAGKASDHVVHFGLVEVGSLAQHVID